MTVSCQTILDRARQLSPLNPSVSTDRVETLTRIRRDQQELWTETTALYRDFFQAVQTIASSSGASGRVFDLSALTPPVERVLLVTLNDGRELSRVVVNDPDAEFPPRYYQRSRTLVEVGNDWSAVAGPVSAQLVYGYGMTDIDPAGALTQNVTVPDQWIDLLVWPLALYLWEKDPGRDPAEGALLMQQLGAWRPEPTGLRASYLAFLAGVGGDRAVTRFDIDR
jgi:hypothetical protein